MALYPLYSVVRIWMGNRASEFHFFLLIDSPSSFRSSDARSKGHNHKGGLLRLLFIFNISTARRRVRAIHSA